MTPFWETEKYKNAVVTEVARKFLEGGGGGQGVECDTNLYFFLLNVTSKLEA